MADLSHLSHDVGYERLEERHAGLYRARLLASFQLTASDCAAAPPQIAVRKTGLRQGGQWLGQQIDSAVRSRWRSLWRPSAALGLLACSSCLLRRCLNC